MENILTKIFACTKKVTFHLEKSLLWICLFEMIQTLFYLILSYNFHDKKDYTFSASQFSFEGYELKTDSLKIVISYCTYYDFFLNQSLICWKCSTLRWSLLSILKILLILGTCLKIDQLVVVDSAQTENIYGMSKIHSIMTYSFIHDTCCNCKKNPITCPHNDLTTIIIIWSLLVDRN